METLLLTPSEPSTDHMTHQTLIPIHYPSTISQPNNKQIWTGS